MCLLLFNLRLPFTYMPHFGPQLSFLFATTIVVGFATRTRWLPVARRLMSRAPSPPGPLPEPVQRCIAAASAKGVELAPRIFKTDQPTAAAAAKALGVPPAQIVNSLVFEVGAKTSRQPVLVLAPGDRRVDPKKLAEKLGVSKSKIKSASADACLKYTGFQAGGVGPCGHLVPPWRTFIEELVFEQPSVWCGAGVKPAMMPLTPQQLLQITGADVCKLVVDADE